MSQALETALTLLVVGMTTVFVILGLVVLSSRLLIVIVNRYFPDPIFESDPARLVGKGHRGLSPEKLAAIVAAVEVLTEGRGRVEKVERAPNAAPEP
ncbi:MAG: oxaloacetate decarboxylase [Bacteroidetes bacterium]|nr:MAG: oxaloacetate decarboxylase [Bacteroidota bacterium]